MAYKLQYKPKRRRTLVHDNSF
uniref:Uncharacterized protein n=1 Tax=Anguilla anguilla TaxID=7936 RepID=A0A0E9U229_ANGAN